MDDTAQHVNGIGVNCVCCSYTPSGRETDWVYSTPRTHTGDPFCEAMRTEMIVFNSFVS